VLAADERLTSLIDFRHQRRFRAKRGENGMGRQMTGRNGEDVRIRVPVGTMVINVDTDEVIGDLTLDGQELKVARGGDGGRGNINFKTSTNRAPRRATTGYEGEERTLKFELKLLADVGLLGFPNAGKSTFIRSVSAATPKVADYPFTTLSPKLGVVSIEPHKSFVIADIPGLIEGAADGAGLGIQFLRHVQRNRVLLHLVNLAAMDGADPAAQVRTTERELRQFDPELLERPRWLLLNKIDLLPEDERQARAAEVIAVLGWEAPWFTISALSKLGTWTVAQKVFEFLDSQRAEAQEAAADAAFEASQRSNADALIDAQRAEGAGKDVDVDADRDWGDDPRWRSGSDA